MDSRTGTLGLSATPVDSLQGFGGMSDPNTLIGVAVSVDDSTEINLLSTADGSLTGQVLLPVNTGLVGNGSQQPFFHCAPGAGLCALYVVEYDPDHTTVIANSVQVWALDGTLVQSIAKVSGDVAIPRDGLDVALMNDGDVTISPDGQYVAAIYDGDVTVYRVSDGSRVKFLP
jgi:hypothetical protein